MCNWILKMKLTRCLIGAIICLFAIIDIVKPLCVLESDFGFKINCAFKKSGLFRVRNLGGIKAHASLGFSLGDELGFDQSLTNQDPSRRRSVSIKNGAPNVIVDTTNRPASKQEKRGKQNRIMMRPVPPSTRPNQAAMNKLSTLHKRVSTTMQPIIVSGSTAQTNSLNRAPPTVTMAKPMPMGVPPFRPLPPKEETLKVLPIATRKTYTPLQIPQAQSPGAYESEKQPILHDNVSKMVSQMHQPYKSTQTNIKVNPFVPMPQAISVIPAPSFNTPHTYNSVSFPNPVSNFVDPVPQQVQDLAYYNTKKVDDYNSISGYSDDTTLKLNKEDINAKIAEIAKAGNISMEAVEAAIALRQQQLLNKYANIPVPTTTTSTTTTEAPIVFEMQAEPEIIVAPAPSKPKRNPTTGKVMNAPREYYPVGYEKNFDDHFQSKVDLPDTNFHCGDQKYFPGLYGDENLGCMVFHVCALTDDGLVMKSFLCPESTLFDQTILKCNWWFYVDCKNTQALYDTNIPVSKSYQLMKALTFFSSYKKEMDVGRPMNPEDVGGIKDAISILENHDTKPAESERVEIVTPSPLIDERNNKKEEITPVYRGNRELNSTERRTRRPQKSEEYKLITLNAGINFNNTKNTERRRIASRNSYSRSSTTSTSTSTTSTTTSTQSPTTSTTEKPETIEIIKQEIKTLDEIKDAKESLTDQIDTDPILKEAEHSPPVRRFYRSSAEKEIAIINNEKVQIVRPTPFQEKSKLDQAVLGKTYARFRRDVSRVYR
ncbi:uncharacterized protein LOC119828911 isoform X1 [Zerene cesonia]|uniref:uncharacterized protein LOC119828911 isoform X1 n=1 Tax=Zerene cesonia TaxID=33412 RepID=UPI0018E4F252|nr:uncharacterized protein LOC119828911 isoform X1 [Zerene cesonia]